MTTPDAFSSVLRDAIQARASSSGGSSVEFLYANNGDKEKQLGDIRDLIAQHADALIVVPTDASATGEIVRLANASATPLVFVNNGPRADYLPGRVAMALSNDLVAGRLQMRNLAALMGGKGNLVIIRGPASHSGATLRTQGVKEILANYPDIKIVAEGEADWDRGKASGLMQSWLGQGIKIDAVAANNDEMALGAYDGWASAVGKGKSPLIGGVDATKAGLAAMATGHMSVTVWQDAQGQGDRAFDDVLGLIANRSVPQYDWIPFQLVTGQTLR